jgi:hypothetical protein
MPSFGGGGASAAARSVTASPAALAKALATRSAWCARRARPRNCGAEKRDEVTTADVSCHLIPSGLRRDPLEVRKATLASVLTKAGPGVRLNEHVEHEDGETVFRHACKLEERMQNALR